MIDQLVTSALALCIRSTFWRSLPTARATRPPGFPIYKPPSQLTFFLVNMSGDPSRTHVRSYSSPRYEREHFISSQRLSAAEILSPSPTPSYQESRGWTPPVLPPLSPGWSQRARSNYTETSYRSYVPEMDEEYPLTECHESVQKLGDMDVEWNQERDQKLKKWVRRFRFVVRVLNLGCRFVSIRSYLILVSS